MPVQATPYSLFISDLHLDSRRPAVLQAFSRFLEQHHGCEALYILGDLVEAWVGDDDDSPIAIELARALKSFSDSGSQLFLMHGNRDFLVGQAFCEAVGATLLPDPTVIDLYGEATLLMHGDSLCTADAEYQAFRKTARDPNWQAQLLNHSLEERRELAANLRAMSKEGNSNKAEDIMDVTAEEVRRCMALHQSHQLIHGHTHRPARHEEPEGARWVLGDWEQKGWAIRADIDGLNLYDFDIIQ
jgi:UDP-2,3-diacylglucosamine hydrolase